MRLTRHGWVRAGPALRRRSVLMALALAAVFALLLLSPLSAYAQSPAACSEDATTSILTLIDRVRTVGTVIAVGAGSLFVLYGGAIYMGSRGSPQAMETGKTAVIAALAGVALVLMASLITNIVIDALKTGTVGAGEDCIGSSNSGGGGSDSGDDASGDEELEGADGSSLRWEPSPAVLVFAEGSPDEARYWLPAHVRMPWDGPLPQGEL